MRRVVEAILTGDREPSAIAPDDISYVRDLGLIKTEGQLAIANPIYREVVPRELTYGTQLTISEQPAWYIRPDGSLDLPKLLAAFQQFFREHSESWLEPSTIRKLAPSCSCRHSCSVFSTAAGVWIASTAWGGGAPTC